MTEKTSNDDSDTVLTREECDLAYKIDAKELPSKAVVRAVASLTNTSVIDLPPLYFDVDPDHLDGLFGPGEDPYPSGDISATFDFNDCHVTVTPNEVFVRERTEDTG